MLTVINDIIHNVKDVVSEITNLSVNDMDSMPDYQSIFKTIFNGLLLVSKEETKQLEAKIIFLENSRQPLIIKEAYFREWLCQFLPEISIVNIYDVLDKTKKFPSINIEPPDKNKDRCENQLIERILKEIKRIYGDSSFILNTFELENFTQELKHFYKQENKLLNILKCLKNIDDKEYENTTMPIDMVINTIDSHLYTVKINDKISLSVFES